MTPLDKSLKRLLKISGHDYVVTLTPDALKITRKGHRLGVDLKWADLVSGQSALAIALHASIGKFQDDVRNDVPTLPRKSKEFARRATATRPHRVTGTRTSPKRSR